MKLIAGLGNPDKKYVNSRHNFGFMVVDAFAKDQGILWKYSQDWMGYFSKTNDFILVKPATYMNKSGQSVQPIFNFYNIDIGDVLVIHDELDLPFGKIRMSIGGSSAGHRGVDSIIAALASGQFVRLRIGVGHSSVKGSDYVLDEFSADEKAKIPEVTKSALGAIRSFLDEGISATMNRFN